MLNELDHSKVLQRIFPRIVVCRQHSAFHGILALHSACKTYVDINNDNLSTLCMLTSVKKIAEQIVEQRNKEQFKSVEDFVTFCFTDKDRNRFIAECTH